MLVLPAVNKVAVIGIWVENVLYGICCVLYGLCVFVLLRRDEGAPLRRMLLAMSTVLFLLSTVYIGASLRQLLEAFVYAPDEPNYTTIYWLTLAATPRVLKGALYGPLVLAQDVILIWRLYVVFLCNWRVIILPIILAVCRVASIVAATAVSTLPNDDGLYGSRLTSLIISAWTFGFVLNASVTMSIVIRLWRLGRTFAAPSTNRFASPIYMVIESGAISSIPNVFVLAYFASNSPAALFVLDIAAQVTALTPLLIIVQVAVDQDRIFMGDLLTRTASSKAPGAVTLQTRVPRDCSVRKDSVLVLQ